MTRPKLLACLVFAALSMSAVARAKGLIVIDKIKSGEAELNVMTFEDDKSRKIGMIGIAASRKVAFTFYRDEWLQVLDIYKKAIETQSPTWMVVGEMTESADASDRSHMTVSAGPGLMITIASPKLAGVTCTLARGDLARFDKALKQIVPTELAERPK